MNAKIAADPAANTRCEMDVAQRRGGCVINSGTQLNRSLVLAHRRPAPELTSERVRIVEDLALTPRGYQGARINWSSRRLVHSSRFVRVNSIKLCRLEKQSKIN